MCKNGINSRGNCNQSSNTIRILRITKEIVFESLRPWEFGNKFK